MKIDPNIFIFGGNKILNCKNKNLSNAVKEIKINRTKNAKFGLSILKIDPYISTIEKSK